MSKEPRYVGSVELKQIYEGGNRSLLKKVNPLLESKILVKLEKTPYDDKILALEQKA